MAVRNPFVAFVTTIVGTGIIAFVAALPSIALPWLGLPDSVPLFWVLGAFVAAGLVSSRFGAIPLVALGAAFIGAFISFFALALLGIPVDLLNATIHGALAGVGAWTASIWRDAYNPSPIKQLESLEKRVCRMCGVKVGVQARKCWSCHASLSRIT